jgi:hypothetical protein
LARPDLDILGSSGLRRSGGLVQEEFNPKLSGRQGARVYRTIRDNDPLVGGIALAFESLIRKTSWYAKPADDTAAALAEAEFLDGCMRDMSHTWADLLAESSTFLWYGWAYHEIVYKLRLGPDHRDPSRRSDFTDGRVGWRKIALRGQDTLSRWEFQEDGGIAGMWQTAPPAHASVFIPIEKALLFRTTSTKGNPEGRSLLRNAYRPWYYRTKLEEIEAIGLERDLAGLPHMQLPPEYLNPNADENHKAIRAQVEQQLANIRNDEQAYLITPSEDLPDGKKSGWKFQLVSAAGRGKASPDVAIKRYRAEVAISLLAEFVLLGTEKVGSFALVQGKHTLFGAVISSILDGVRETLNRYAVARLFALNGVKRELRPSLEYADVAAADIEVFAGAVSQLLTAGGLTPDAELEAHIRQTLKLPEKLESEEPEEEKKEDEEETDDGPDDGDEE